MSQNKLIALISDNGDINERLLRAKKQVSEISTNLHSHVNNVLSTYKEEITQGTLKKQLLLQEGKYLRSAKDESDPLKGFIPSNETPILNFLFFSQRDGNYDFGLETLREQKYADRDINQLKEELDSEYATLADKYDDTKKRKNLPKNMEDFLYENMDHETFKKLKKLKTLAISGDSFECKKAEQRCKELCIKHNLEYERITSYYED